MVEYGSAETLLLENDVLPAEHYNEFYFSVSYWILQEFQQFYFQVF